MAMDQAPPAIPEPEDERRAERPVLGRIVAHHAVLVLDRDHDVDEVVPELVTRVSGISARSRRGPGPPSCDVAAARSILDGRPPNVSAMISVRAPETISVLNP